jgi:hypothetical protein
MPERSLLILQAPGEPDKRADKNARGKQPRVLAKSRQAERLDSKVAALRQVFDERRARLQIEVAALCGAGCYRQRQPAAVAGVPLAGPRALASAAPGRGGAVLRAHRLRVTRESDGVEYPNLAVVFHRVFPLISRRVMCTRESHSVASYGHRYVLERVHVPMR